MADFDLSGGLLNLFGGGGGGVYDDLLTEEQKKRISQGSLASIASALLKAGGPSTQRVGFGQALGSALEAGAGAAERGQMNAVQQILMRQKIDEMKRAQALQGSIAGILTAPTPQGPSAATQALASAEGMPVGPTLTRATMMDNIKPPSAEEIKANKYLQIADVYAAQGRPEEAQKYQTMAEKFNPKPEVVGQPFEVSSSDGKPILVQQYKNGTIKTMEGYGPKRDVVLQNLGGQTVAIDKSKLTGKETFTQTMTPGEVASNIIAQGNLAVNRGQLGVAQGGLGLRQKEFDRGAFDVKETSAGFAYVPKMPGGTALPVMGAGGEQLMPSKEAPADYQKAAKKLNDLKGNLSSYKTEIESGKIVFPSSIPLPFDAKIPLPTGADTARTRGKYQALLMGVKDLYDLGALTGPDMGIISQQLTNPASFSGVFTSQNAMMEQIGVLENMLQRSEENLSSTYGRKIPKASELGLQQAAPAQKKMVYKNGVFVFE